MKEEITIGDLAARTQHVVGRENDVVRSQLTRNRVTILTGTARLADDHLIEVHDGPGRVCQVSAEKIVIATGTRPPGRAASPSTSARSSTPTGLSISRGFPGPWWWRAPG